MRPIIAKFVQKRIRRCSEKHKQYGISEQFPLKIEQKRREFYRIMKKAKNEGKKCKFVKDKLFINGKPYENKIQSNEGSEFREILMQQRENRSHEDKTESVNGRRFKTIFRE